MTVQHLTSFDSNGPSSQQQRGMHEEGRKKENAVDLWLVRDKNFHIAAVCRCEMPFPHPQRSRSQELLSNRTTVDSLHRAVRVRFDPPRILFGKRMRAMKNQEEHRSQFPLQSGQQISILLDSTNYDLAVHPNMWAEHSGCDSYLRKRMATGTTNSSSRDRLTDCPILREVYDGCRGGWGERRWQVCTRQLSAVGAARLV